MAASVVGTIAASPRNGAAIAVAMRGARAWASNAASITDVTATTTAPPPPPPEPNQPAESTAHAVAAISATHRTVATSKLWSRCVRCCFAESLSRVGRST